jgi:hypothetical protein
MIRRLQKFAPSKVCPNPQLGGATLLENATAPSPVIALKEMAWPCIPLFPVNCHICPQLRFKGRKSVLEPLMYNCCTSPAPPTLVTRTSRKYGLPLIVNLMPPDFEHDTLQHKPSSGKRQKKKQKKKTHIFKRKGEKKNGFSQGDEILPSVVDGDDAANGACDLAEDRLGQVEVLLGGVAPASVGAGRTEVGCGNDGRASREAVLRPRWVTCELVAGATAEAAVEQSCTQCSSVGAVASVIEITKSASSTYSHKTHNIQKSSPIPTANIQNTLEHDKEPQKAREKRKNKKKQTNRKIFPLSTSKETQT